MKYTEHLQMNKKCLNTNFWNDVNKKTPKDQRVCDARAASQSCCFIRRVQNETGTFSPVICLCSVQKRGERHAFWTKPHPEYLASVPPRLVEHLWSVQHLLSSVLRSLVYYLLLAERDQVVERVLGDARSD